MKIPDNLECRIMLYEGRAKEFINSESLVGLKKNAEKKANYFIEKKNISGDYKAFAKRAVYFVELILIYSRGWNDNLNRSLKDKNYEFTIEDQEGETKPFLMAFPQENAFFKEEYYTNLYSVQEIYLNQEVQVRIENEFSNYEECIKYFEGEFLQGA